MAITLDDYVHIAKTVKSGWDQWDMTAGEQLGVGTTNPTVLKLLETCPAGKAWTVRVIVEISETDV